jgi:hypothetical protein
VRLNFAFVRLIFQGVLLNFWKHSFAVMWDPVTTAWCVFVMRLEETASIYGG